MTTSSLPENQGSEPPELRWNRRERDGQREVCRVEHDHLSDDCQWEVPDGIRVPAWFTYDVTSPIGGHIEIAASSPSSLGSPPKWLNPKKLAGDAVQRLADSEPTEDSIEGMERLRGTPQESMFVVNAAELQRVIECTLEDTIYDATLPSGSPPELKKLSELLDELESATVKLSKGGAAEAWREHANRYDTARSAIESLFASLEEERDRLRVYNNSFKAEVEELRKSETDLGNALSAKSMEGITLSAALSSLKEDGLTPEEAKRLVGIIETTPLRYPPELTVLYKKLRRISGRSTNSRESF